MSGVEKVQKGLSTIDYRLKVKHTKLMELCFACGKYIEMVSVFFWNDRLACVCVCVCVWVRSYLLGMHSIYVGAIYALLSF